MADVQLDGIRKAYGSLEILRDIDLEIEHGEFVVFVGPSGSGKSTLLRMIGGLEHISGGTLKIDSRVVNRVDAADRNLGMVFQSYALYPHLSVRDNLAFPLRMAKARKEEIAVKVGNAAKLLQIEHLLDRKPKQLSGGQRQRVAIGRAIVREPKVFLFDEPLSNLDTELRVQMRVQIAKLHRQLGNTMIYVTHDQVEAMTMADKIVVLKDGRIEQVGSPHDLYHKPATQFVAGFIGSPRMNFLPCKVKSRNESQVEIELGSNGRWLPVDGRGVGQGATVMLGIRPDDFIAPSGNPGELLIDIEVDFVEHLGSATYLYGTALGENVVARSPDDHFHVGRQGPISLAIAASDCHVFGSDGKALPRFQAPKSWS
ncbi:ABC transporter ATP-binding protein [Shinella sumterensis]|uniref:Sn-glycerol-3-phosphate ABC transporter ATP-binding protein UgpC n=1 Tax=Shinella sumterensis TaxID=1967501 RepID=A0AA50CPB9_9HYPH|nr:sn-glycerol-3-phosphate ABC transporter ATP-binding protein UgpC [Shinella sumterensis]WLR99652.1 sn-glycerol-3-phosphate ABC transporter ATP-binding protein UgpC [Shinella sumterensis]